MEVLVAEKGPTNATATVAVSAPPASSPVVAPASVPLKNAISFASEAIIPGGSNLVKGDLKQAAIHGAVGLMAKSLFGLPGLILVTANSFVKATTGAHLHDHLGLRDPMMNP
jgi:hypothetical protein